MNLPSNSHSRLMSAYQLFESNSISISTFEHIRTLIKGLHPELDKKLETCSKALTTLQKFESGDIISLTAEGLPEDTEEKKRRKKALLFFIDSLKNLKNEIKRIDAEITNINTHGKSVQSQAIGWGRIIGFAKGRFGIVTLIALAVIGFGLLKNHGKNSTASDSNTLVSPSQLPSPLSTTNTAQTTKVIIYNGKQIPLSQLYIGRGADCDSPHYHANTGSVTTTDETIIPDPENCGYGKVKDVQVIEVNVITSPTPR